MMRWIRRILLSLLGAIGVMLLLMIGVIVFDGTFGMEVTANSNVTYPAADGTTLNGYLARPADDGVYPGVLMAHEWWGLNEEITELADALAEEGYVVLVPDTYRGEVTSLIPRALVLRLSVPFDRVDSDMQAAWDYLTGLEGVSSEIGLIGFCFGGEVVMRYAAINPNVAATINLYGSTPTEVDSFGVLPDAGAGPVLGIFGSDDQGISVESVNAFDAAMDETAIEHTITIYEGMGHAFVQPDVITEEGEPRNAWLQILDFFDEELSANPDATSES